MEIHALPEEKQKELRKGISKSNKIFKKGRSEALIYKKHPEEPVKAVFTSH